MRRVLEWTHERARIYGGDPDQIFILVSSGSVVASDDSAHAVTPPGIREWSPHLSRAPSLFFSDSLS